MKPRYANWLLVMGHWPMTPKKYEGIKHTISKYWQRPLRLMDKRLNKTT